MDEEGDQGREFSVALSRALDEIGLNEATVKKRRDTFLFVETIHSIFVSNADGQKTTYSFGSQSEGATTPGLISDYDGLRCLDEYMVIHDVSEWTPGKINLLMLQGDTEPGYCRLQLMGVNKPEPVVLHAPSGERVNMLSGAKAVKLLDANFVFDSYGRVIMNNTLAINMHTFFKSGLQTNGPAETLFMPHNLDVDTVQALRCTTRLHFIDIWARRHRRGDWPSQDLIQQVTNQNVFLVPVGHKLSPTPDLEWRISTSLAERCLMFSLNIVQIKCYVLLKMLVKDFITPLVGDCISSYHCKTTVFYCIENEEAAFWQEDNLLHCLTRCLNMLHAFVTEGVCPHFINSDVNLFAGKVTSKNKDKLQSLLKSLINTIRPVLQKVRIDSLGQVLSKHLGKPQTPAILDSEATVLIFAQIEFYRHRRIANTSIQLQLHPHCVKTSIDKLTARMHKGNAMERKATRQLLEIQSRYLGSLFASSALFRNEPITQEAMDLLHTGTKHNISARLKLASVLLCNGDLQQVELLLEEIENHFSTDETKPTCACGLVNKWIFTRPFAMALFSKPEDETLRDGMFDYCVSFTSCEINCIPLSLRYELFRSCRGETERRHPIRDVWMALAVVDAYPYLYFLKFITFNQLGKTIMRVKARKYLEMHIILMGELLSHSETAWNLLGQCYEMEQQFDSALRCYTRSLDIRPRNNAANWLVSALMYKRIQQHN